MSEAVNNYRLATRMLLRAGLAQYKDEQPEEYKAITLAAQQGAHFSVTCALSPAGLDEVQIDIVMLDGQRISLMRLEQFDSGAIR